MPPKTAQYEAICRVLESDDFTPGEKHCLQWQFAQMVPMGSFFTALWQAIELADPTNRAALRLGFPDDVAAHASYKSGYLAPRWEAFGVAF